MNASPLSIVTGGASGIGLACARRLKARGDRVIVIDLQAPEDGPGYACDISDEAAVAATAARIEDEHGPAHVLVNSAGIIQAKQPPEALDMATWDRIMAVDLRGSYLASVAFGARMARRGEGAIINIASITALRSVPLHAYAPAKAAVVAMTECLAAEWGRSGVRVNAVSPGYTLTPALQAAIDRGDRDADELARLSALGRMVMPEKVADAVAFLASPQARAITGVNLPVDAGWLVASPWQTYGGVPGARAGGG